MLQPNAQLLLQRVFRSRGARKTGMAGASRRVGRCHLDLVTITVVGVIVLSYIVGSLTSSVETEQELPHRY